MPNSTIIAKADKLTDPQSALLRALEAYMRDSPDLLANSPYDHFVVAYHDSKRVAMAPYADDVRRECERLGLPRDQIALVTISPPDDEEELEDSLGLFEFDEIEDDIDSSSQLDQSS